MKFWELNPQQFLSLWNATPFSHVFCQLVNSTLTVGHRPNYTKEKLSTNNKTYKTQCAEYRDIYSSENEDGRLSNISQWNHYPTQG